MKNHLYESLTTVFSVLVVAACYLLVLPRTRSFFGRYQGPRAEISCRFCRKNCP
ncbi:LpxT activity modulator PmrR [Shigella flexneri]